MKKTVVLLLSLIVLTACAGMKTTGRSMAEDPGSPQKTALLQERVNDFWNAFIKEDYHTVYSIYDPFFRARYSDEAEAIAKMMGKVKYHKSEVKDMQVEGNVARVKMGVVYSLPEVKMKTQTFSVSETPGEFEETWLYVYDNWYKEYFSTMMDQGFAKY